MKVKNNKIKYFENVNCIFIGNGYVKISTDELKHLEFKASEIKVWDIE